jgi:hypothetical protein
MPLNKLPRYIKYLIQRNSSKTFPWVSTGVAIPAHHGETNGTRHCIPTGYLNFLRSPREDRESWPVPPAPNSHSSGEAKGPIATLSANSFLQPRRAVARDRSEPQLTICGPSPSAKSWVMSALTRRREKDRHQESWQIYYGDICVGWIGERAGVPKDVEQWGWNCGFYAVSHRERCCGDL